MIVRANELRLKDIFRSVGYLYKVVEITDKEVYYVSIYKKGIAAGIKSKQRIGINSKQRIELIEKNAT